MRGEVVVRDSGSVVGMHLDCCPQSKLIHSNTSLGFQAGVVGEEKRARVCGNGNVEHGRGLPRASDGVHDHIVAIEDCLDDRPLLV